MANTLLITFGCSWTYGVGVNYEAGMSRQAMMSQAWDPEICDQLSWRGLLSKKFDLHNVNHARGGSSNQKQFRKAIEFFGSERYLDLRQRFDGILVLWGITSTARNELWSVDRHQYHNFFLQDDDVFSRFMVKHCYDHDAEVFQLRNLMLFWNQFFKGQNIKNFWFDTFNSHNYDHDFLNHKHTKTYRVDPDKHEKKQRYDSLAGPDWPSFQQFCLGEMDHVPASIQEEIYQIFGKPFDSDDIRLESQNLLPTVLDLDHHDHTLLAICNLLDHSCLIRDLMSQLMKQAGIDLASSKQTYHLSSWNNDREHMDQLVSLGLLNPYSYHPTKQGHALICDYFANKLQAELQ